MGVNLSSNILTSKDKRVRYKYRVKSFYIKLKDELIEISENKVGNIFILHDYIENAYPILKVELGLESSLYYKILKNKDSAKFIINIQKKYVRTNTKKSLYKKYIDDTFSLILNDDDENLNTMLHDIRYPKGDTDELDAQRDIFEFYLFKSETIRNSKKFVNKILKNVTVTDTLAYIGSHIGLSNILMTKSDNTNVYDTVLIPPMNSLKAFNYIDTYYGIHKTGSIIYFDLDRSYIIDYSGDCTAYEPDEIQCTKIIIPKEGSEISAASLSVIKYYESNNKYIEDTNNNYVIADPTTLKISNESISTEVIGGNEADIIDTDTGDIEYTSSKNVNTNTIENVGENKYFSKIFKTQTNSNKRVLTITLSNCDIDAFKPNKKFVMMFEERDLAKKYNGKYKLCKNDIALTKEGEVYVTTMNCVFRQI